MYCRKCNEFKEAQCFSKSKFRKSGLRTYCKLCEKTYTSSWRKANSEKDKEVKKQYYLAHKPEIIENNRKRQKARRIVDINFRLLINLRRRLNNAIRGYSKSARTLELLGVTIPELKAHLESQFQSGMSWDNYGKWHIDHIQPCKSYNMNYPADQERCFNYKNLQPLWAKDNLKKHASVPTPIA